LVSFSCNLSLACKTLTPLHNCQNIKQCLKMKLTVAKISHPLHVGAEAQAIGDHDLLTTPPFSQ
jgi:hypothetical protein